MNTGYFLNPKDEKTESQRDCAQRHTASKWWCQDLNQEFTPKSIFNP